MGMFTRKSLSMGGFYKCWVGSFLFNKETPVAYKLPYVGERKDKAMPRSALGWVMKYTKLTLLHQIITTLVGPTTWKLKKKSFCVFFAL